MRRLFLAITLMAILVPGYGVLAHGDEDHGEATAVEPSATLAAPAGAGSGGEGETGPGASPAAGEGPSLAAPPPVANREVAAPRGIADVLKALHPATVHFPIAFLLLAAGMEMWAAVRGKAAQSPAVGVLVYAGAAGAALAALMGWVHTGLWFGGDFAMQLHRWNGMAILAAGLVLAVLWRSGRSTPFFRAVLAVTAIMILLQGFYGGELAHGAGHLFG